MIIFRSTQYNLKFLIYQGYDLGDGSQLSMDAQFRVSTPCGDISTDPFQNSLTPKWNCKLQAKISAHVVIHIHACKLTPYASPNSG